MIDLILTVAFHPFIVIAYYTHPALLLPLVAATGAGIWWTWHKWDAGADRRHEKRMAKARLQNERDRAKLHAS